MKYINEKDDKNKKNKKKGVRMESENNKEEVMFHNLYYCSNKVHCDNCEKDITRHARILCHDCPDTSDICMNCFLNLTEFEQHQLNHSYSIISKLNFPLYVEDWNAEEELLLIEGIEKKGFGNWQDIQELISTDKSQEEIAEHYDKVILSGFYKNAPLLSRRNPDTLELIRPKKVATTKKYTKREESAPKPAGRLTTAPPASQSGQEIVGYMPKRGDFDIEFDNDAELLLAEMEFNDDDTPFEIEMKLKVLDIYNIRLDERIKRKKFVIERDLLNLKKQNILDKQRTKEEKELHNLMKPFARFNKPEDHEKLVQNLIRERQLRSKIEELRYYRKLGMKTFEDIEQYLAEKRKKDEAWQKRQKQNDAFIYETTKNLGQRFMQRRTRFTPLLEQRDYGDRKHKALPHFSEEEYNLCEKLGLSHHEYLILKEVLVRESVRLGVITKEQQLQNFKLDKDRVGGVFDYLVTKGLIHQKD